jgi:hypothetical protein
MPLSIRVGIKYVVRGIRGNHDCHLGIALITWRFDTRLDFQGFDCFFFFNPYKERNKLRKKRRKKKEADG